MKNIVLDSIKSYIRQFHVLHLIYLVAYTVFLFGSWVLFGIGGIILLPIISGITSVSLSSARNKNIKIKDLFKYFSRSLRKQEITHYFLMLNIFVVIFLVFFVSLQYFINSLLSEVMIVNIFMEMSILLFCIIVYIFVGTYFSLTSYIRIDKEVDTMDSIRESIALVKTSILKYTIIRFLFFYRNFVIFSIIFMRLGYHYGLSETPYQLSGTPVVIMILTWLVALILTSPIYESLRAHMYLSSLLTIK